MLWAALFSVFFRLSSCRGKHGPSDEAYEGDTHLSAADIAVDSMSNPSIFSVHLKCSKTYPFRAGIDVYVGRSSGMLCPVKAVLRRIYGGKGFFPGSALHVQGWPAPYKGEICGEGSCCSFCGWS
jgi:hypothetical protein